MLINHLANHEFSPCNLNTTAEKAQEIIHNFKLTHIPVFDGLQFLGNLRGDYVEHLQTESKLIEIKKDIKRFFLSDKNTIFDALSIFTNYNTNIIPIINNEEHYLGYLMLEDVLNALYRMPFVSEPGIMMTLEIALKKYSLSEVAKIVESNNAKLIAAFVSKYNGGNVEIMIKLITDNPTTIGETFERFGYQVLEKFFYDEKEDLLKDRYNQLIKFLDV